MNYTSMNIGTEIDTYIVNRYGYEGIENFLNFKMAEIFTGACPPFFWRSFVYMNFVLGRALSTPQN